MTGCHSELMLSHRADAGAAGFLLSQILQDYEGLRALLLPQCFRAMWQRKKRPEGCFASN